MAFGVFVVVRLGLAWLDSAWPRLIGELDISPAQPSQKIGHLQRTTEITGTTLLCQRRHTDKQAFQFQCSGPAPSLLNLNVVIRTGYVEDFLSGWRSAPSASNATLKLWVGGGGEPRQNRQNRQNVRFLGPWLLVDACFEVVRGCTRSFPAERGPLPPPPPDKPF